MRQTRPRSTCTTVRLEGGGTTTLGWSRYQAATSTRTNLLTSRYIWGFIDYMMLWQYTWSHTIYWNLANQHRNTRLHSNNYHFYGLTLHNVTRGISKLSSLFCLLSTLLVEDQYWCYRISITPLLSVQSVRSELAKPSSAKTNATSN